MPIYEYQREDGSVFEIMQKISEDPLIVCPETGQKVTRLISQVVSHFKGSGFYQTDYDGGNASAGTSGGSSKKSDSSGGSETSSKTKAADSGSKDSGSKDNASKGKPCGTKCGCH